jgi:hypothetical protein
VLLATIVAIDPRAHADPVVVKRPLICCPQSDLEEAECQKEYDLEWSKFRDAVRQTTDAIDAELVKQFDQATAKKDLELAKQWRQKRDDFFALGRLDWQDGEEERGRWNAKYLCPFPENLSLVFQKHQDQYLNATEDLETAYSTLTDRLTQKQRIAAAAAIDDERKRVIAGNTPRKSYSYLLDARDLDFFDVAGVVKPIDDGILFDSKARPRASAVSRVAFTPPIRVELKVTALDPRSFDIFPGLFCTKDDPEESGIQVRWGDFHNTQTRLFVFKQLRNKKNRPIVPGKQYTLVLEVTKARSLTVLIDGEEIHREMLAADLELKGGILLGGGVGKVLYKAITIEAVNRLNPPKVRLKPDAKAGIEPQRPAPEKGIDPYADRAGAIVCPFNGHRYKFFRQSLTWDAAKKFCEARGGHLLMLETRAEHEFVTAAFQRAFAANKDQFGDGVSCWMGATEVQVGGQSQWRWLDANEAMGFTKWRGHHPHRLEKDRDYMTLSIAKGDWVNFWGHQHPDVFIICEWDR